MEIDDDHFEYEGGFRQCISGFGRNAKDAVDEFRDNPYSQTTQDRIDWHINELVRWCQGLNHELKVALRNYEIVSRELINCGNGYDEAAIAELTKETRRSDS